MKQLILGVTGASGILYAKRFVEVLPEEIFLHLVISRSAQRVVSEEMGRGRLLFNRKNMEVHAPEDIGASIASGSFQAEAMVILPCSMKTLAAVSNGYADNLISRAADVMIKERKNLILVPRETPFSAIHLENMLKLSRLGVCILPANPGFYHEPATIEDLIDFVVVKVLDQLKIENSLMKRWGEKCLEQSVTISN